MRYGVISDVHGNLPALEEALRALRRERVDGYLCAGDLVGYGPMPNECVARVSELGALCAAGNHDLMAIGTLPYEHAMPLARDTMRFTREVLSPEARDYLAALPRIALGPGGIVVAHGSLDDPREYVGSPRRAAIELERLERRAPDARIVVLGHVHRALAYGQRRGWGGGRGEVPLPGPERHLLNPGSVGQSRERRARAIHGARPRSWRGPLPRRRLRHRAGAQGASRAGTARAGLPRQTVAPPERAARRAPDGPAGGRPARRPAQVRVSRRDPSVFESRPRRPIRAASSR